MAEKSESARKKKKKQNARENKRINWTDRAMEALQAR